MNTVLKITEEDGIRVTDDDNKLTAVLVSLALRNTFMPNITRVVYNNPVTKVYFADGSWVMVKTSEHDEFDKERGLIYAMVKRMMGRINPETNEVESNGYMCQLKKFVDNSYDQKAEQEKRAEKKRLAKERAKNSAPSVKNTTEKPSLRKCVRDLTDILADIKSAIRKD